MLGGRSLGGRGDEALPRSRAVTRRRLETLPIAATILSRVLRAVQAETVVFSALGLREGHLFGLMPESERVQDPVLSAAEAVARREARFDDLGDALSAWTDPLFPEEDPAARRLRRAACLLSDISWREHPDYRAGQAWLRILHLPFVGASHGDRVFLAYAVYSRYGGRSRAKEVARYLTLITPETAARAPSSSLPPSRSAASASPTSGRPVPSGRPASHPPSAGSSGSTVQGGWYPRC